MYLYNNIKRIMHVYIYVYIFTCVIYPFSHCMFIETCFSMLYHNHAFACQYTCFTKGRAVTSLTTVPMVDVGLGLLLFVTKGTAAQEWRW